MPRGDLNERRRPCSAASIVLHHCLDCFDAVAEYAQQVAGRGVSVNLSVLDHQHEAAQTVPRGDKGLPGFGRVVPLDAAKSAAAVRSATTLRSLSRTLGSVVRSAASAHCLA
jgi:hypothetical protein